MREADLLAEVTQDLSDAPERIVIYLEGKTDPPIFFGLLGTTPPLGGLHRGVLVRGSSGAAMVKALVEAAGRNRYPGVYGIVDGDGEDLDTFTASFAPPFAGPCFSWPAYCIENMLVKTGWPAGWGAPPDWTRALLDHVPHVALNRIHRELHGLRLWRHNDPRLGEPLMTVADATAALARDKHRIAAYDVEARLATEVAAMEARVLGSLDEGHALVNGKWLVDVFAPGRIGPHARPQRCRDEWTAHAVATGGLAEVRELWQRITGRPA